MKKCLSDFLDNIEEWLIIAFLLLALFGVGIGFMYSVKVNVSAKQTVTALENPGNKSVRYHRIAGTTVYSFMSSDNHVIVCGDELVGNYIK